MPAPFSKRDFLYHEPRWWFIIRINCSKLSNRCTPKAAFLALDLSMKCSRLFPSDLKTDQEEI